MKGYLQCYKDPSDIDFMFCVEGLKNSYCFIYFKYLIVFVIFMTSSTSNVLSMTTMMKLDGINYHKWNKTLVMNLTFMKLDFSLEIDPPKIQTDDSSVAVKKLYKD